MMETRKILTILVLALGLILCQPKVSEAAEMGTAFTYQGHLYDANYPADGLYDFQFKLYDANTAGSQVGSDVNKPDVDVISAQFTVELDFGSDVFDGNDRWLQIGVRPGDLNDPCEYTILEPRVEVTPTPYALYAKTAGAGHSLDAADGSPTNAVYVDDNGNVGIGTTSPDEKLTVEGTIKSTTSVTDGSGVYGKATGSTGRGVYGYASNTGSYENYGGYFEARGDYGRGVYGLASSTGNSTNIGGRFVARASSGRGVLGHATALSGSNYGVYAKSESTAGRGVYGHAGASSGTNYGVYGETASPSGYAGYFKGGKNYFEGNVGIGTTNPQEKLDVGGNINVNSVYKIGGSTVLSTLGTKNTFVGIEAGAFNTTGYSNTFLGELAGRWNTTGYDNTFLGELAGYWNTTGYDNTFLGELAGYWNSTGWGNTFSGLQAGAFNTTGNYNTAVGSYANVNNQEGSRNTTIGYEAGIGTTVHNKSGNVFLGYQAGYYETGSNKLYIDNSNTTIPLIYGDFATNVLRINGDAGIGRTPATNELEVEGNASKTAAGDWLANSDERIKADIQTVTGALETLDKVRLVSFKYSDDYQAKHPSIEKRRYLNVIAQEFRQVFPEYVKSSKEKLPNGDEILQVDAYPLTVYSAAAVQELYAIVKAKDAKIEALKERLSKMETLVAELVRQQEGGAK